jgi:hypothetical protein
MKKLFLILVLALLVKPAFGFSYAGELTNENETYSLIMNITYPSITGSSYFIYGIYSNNATILMVVQDHLGNLVMNNDTLKGIFHDYRIYVIDTLQNDTITIENPNSGAQKDLDLFNIRIREKSDSVNRMIVDVENLMPHYKDLVHNLTSQGIYAPNTVDFLSNMESSFWNATGLLNQDMFNSASDALGYAMSEGSKIDVDVNSSLKLNEGSVALNRSLSMMREAIKLGYNTTEIESYYDESSTFLNEAKDSYIVQNYDDVDAKVASVIDLANRISSELDALKNPPAQNISPTGFDIKVLSWAPYVLVVAIVGVAVAFIVYKRRKPITYIPY